MVKFLLILTIGLISCGPTKTREDLLIDNAWTVTKAENLTTDEFIPEDLPKESLLRFDENGTFFFEFKGIWSSEPTVGNWKISNDNVVLMELNDTTDLKIEKLTGNEFICLTHEEDTFRYTLRPVKNK